MALRIDLVRALRESEYREEISADLESDMTDCVMLDAADEIERLRFIAYQPRDKHKLGCDCIQCVPF